MCDQVTNQGRSRPLIGPRIASALWVAIALFLGGDVHAQRVPITRYSVADGLAHSAVHSIHQDRKGYLWIATSEGLSRFDGYTFTNYNVRDGIGNPFVNAVTEDGQGRIWVGTNGGGVSCLVDLPERPQGQAGVKARAREKFRSFLVGTSPASNRVNAIVIDADDSIWCATDAGLYRAARASGLDLKFEVMLPHEPVAQAMTAFADSRGRRWFGIAQELVEAVEGRLNVYGPSDDVGRFPITGVTEDPEGRLLVANNRDVFEFVPPPDSAGRGTWRRISALDRVHGVPFFTESIAASVFHSLAGSLELGIYSLAADSTGALWIGTERGLFIRKDGRQTLYTRAQGLSDDTIMALQEDRDRNMWIGTAGGGLCKLSGELIVSFKEGDGLPDHDVSRVVESRTGHIYVSTVHGGLVEIQDGRVILVHGSQRPPFKGAWTRVLQDRRGDWWIASDQELYRFKGTDFQLGRGKKFGTEDGLPAARVYWIFEDSVGTIWASLLGRGLYFFDLAGGDGRFHRLWKGDSAFSSVTCAVSDRSGALWLGEHEMLGKLIDGQIVAVHPSEGLPETDPRALFLDSRGWLWVGLRYRGASVTKDPTAQHPTFVNYSSENGLASNTVWSIAEDDLGRIYLGTGKGLDRLDPATGSIHHFGTSAGLAGDEVHHCLKDSRGNIWVATTMGLSKLNPRAEPAMNRAPPIYLSRIQVAGEDLAIPDTGSDLMRGLELAPSRNNLLIEYVGLDFRSGSELRYQYKLEAVDEAWSAPSNQRSVNYARLAPGSYRFFVRAVSQDGVESSQPAVLEFRILPPIWRRWWFLMPALVLTGLIIYAAYRYHLARLLQIERVRTRIATDLHDDIGASLSRMAILSEVVKQRMGPAADESRDLLTDIADSGRRVVDSMSDIVWSIDPRRDDMSNLVSRIRDFAAGVLNMKPIKWTFAVPAEIDQIKLGPDQRRQVFLILKEAITNVARHAGCGSVQMSIAVSGNRLVAEVSDDGCGFPTEATANGGRGQGLESMRSRAAHLGGKLSITSVPGQGTRLRLDVPLKGHTPR